MHKRFFPRGRGLAGAGLAAGLTIGAIGAQIGSGAAEAAPQGSVSMALASAKQSVRYGESIRLAGRAAPGAAGRDVRLERSFSGTEFKRIARATTGAGGSYRFALRARSSATYRVVSDTGATAPARRVAVTAAIKARSTRHVLGGRSVRVRGKLLPGSGRPVTIQVLTRRGWKTVDRARTHAGGRFSASFRPKRAGTFRLRARYTGNRTLAAATARSWKVRSYRAGFASWYGPGLYGNKLGCGGTLTPGTLGVANKRLPCGTRVTLRYHGRSATVRVVDRGPYVGGREWDLTAATKAKLGFASTGTVWSTK